MSKSAVSDALGRCHYYRTVCNLPCHIDDSGRLVLTIGAGTRALTTPEQLGATIHTHLNAQNLLGPIIWHRSGRYTFLTTYSPEVEQDSLYSSALLRTNSLIIPPTGHRRPALPQRPQHLPPLDPPSPRRLPPQHANRPRHPARMRHPMNTTGSPRPDEPDVHLSVFLHGARFDYVACRTAAEHFTREWNTTQPDTATILPGIPHGIPRLPNERLYLYP